MRLMLVSSAELLRVIWGRSHARELPTLPGCSFGEALKRAQHRSRSPGWSEPSQIGAHQSRRGTGFSPGDSASSPDVAADFSAELPSTCPSLAVLEPPEMPICVDAEVTFCGLSDQTVALTSMPRMCSCLQ